MQDILKQLQVHIPFDQLSQKHLDKVLREQINPEIAFTSTILDRFADRDYAAVGHLLSGADRVVTFHAPFMDLRPGAIDPKIRQASLERFRRVFEIAAFFRPQSIVFHPSYDDKYYVSSGRMWLANSIDTWTQLIPLAEGLASRIALENVYEADPGYPAQLLEALPPGRVGFCFDTGHFNVFSKVPLESWMDRLGSRLIEVHLHDNHGSLDEHLPVGEGSFPFIRLFSIFRERRIRPILTVEAHSEKDLAKTMDNIRTLGLLEGFRDAGAMEEQPVRPGMSTSLPGRS